MGARRRDTFDRSLSSDATYTRADFRRDFPDNAACLDWLLHHRWPDGVTCAKCQRVTSHSRVKSRACYACNHCGTQVYPTAGTIYHKSTVNLVLWFEAVFLVAQTRCGISAKQIEREIGVTYKTAHRMMKLIRSQMGEGEGIMLGGDVEVDETYFNRSRRNRPGEVRRPGRSPHSRTVVGAVERGGRVIARHVPGQSGAHLTGHVRQFVMPDSTVFTDELQTYVQNLPGMGYRHRKISHSAKVYVMGDVHTQTIEGFWSLLKRGIAGVYHAVSETYLQNYIDEYAWRYNHRSQAQGPMFLTLLERVVGAVAA